MPTGVYKRKTIPIKERFEKKVRVDDHPHPILGTPCWNWTASQKGKGYGQINYKGSMVSVHRVSYIIHNKRIPTGKHVLHKCDNRICVNPDHLFLGTNADNVKDMVAKGRQQGKLTADQVKEIRMANGTLSEIGKRYGVSLQAIHYHKNVR